MDFHERKSLPWLPLGLLLSGDSTQLGLSLRSSHRFGPEGLSSAPLAEVKPRAAKLALQR